MNKGYAFLGIAVLLSSSFLDNMRGPLLPILCETLNLEYAHLSWMLITGNITAVITFFTIGKALKKFSEKKVVLFALASTLLPISLAPFLNQLAMVITFGTLLGMVVAMLGALSNILVVIGTKPEIRSRIMALAHSMYGLGSLLGPLTLTLFIPTFPWWTALGVSALLFGMCFALASKLPPKNDQDDSKAPSTKMSQEISHPNWVKNVVLFAFTVFVCGEVMATKWLTSYLVNGPGLSVESASKYLTAFFLVLTLTRLLVFLKLKKSAEHSVLLGAIVAAISCYFLARMGYLWCLPGMGVLGVFFPVFYSRLSNQFPKIWRELTIQLFIILQLAVGTCHFLMGKVMDLYGAEAAFMIPIALLIVAMPLYLLTVKVTRPQENALLPENELEKKAA